MKKRRKRRVFLRKVEEVEEDIVGCGLWGRFCGVVLSHAGWTGWCREEVEWDGDISLID